MRVLESLSLNPFHDYLRIVSQVPWYTILYTRIAVCARNGWYFNNYDRPHPGPTLIFYRVLWNGMESDRDAGVWRSRFRCVPSSFSTVPCDFFRSRFRCVSSSVSTVPCDFFRSRFRCMSSSFSTVPCDCFRSRYKCVSSSSRWGRSTPWRSSTQLTSSYGPDGGSHRWTGSFKRYFR